MSAPATPSSSARGSASSTRSSWSKLSSSFGAALERSSRLPRIVNTIAITCWAASGLEPKRSYGRGWKSGPAGMRDARQVTIRSEPRCGHHSRRTNSVSRSSPSSDGRPPAPAPKRSAGQSSIDVTTSLPSIANRSEHSNVIADTTPSSPRFGAIEKNSSGPRA